MTPVIQIQNLQVHKGGRCVCSVPVLQLNAGDHLAVIGANGSGKTTLLRTMMGLETERTGESTNHIAVKDRIYVHQEPYLFRGTVRFNLEYGLKARHMPRDAREQLIRSWSKRFGIGDLEDRQAGTLSGGERRRVALTRVFALEPELLLLDEPFSDLDENGTALVRQAIEETPATIVIASPVPLDALPSVRCFHLERAG